MQPRAQSRHTARTVWFPGSEERGDLASLPSLPVWGAALMKGEGSCHLCVPADSAPSNFEDPASSSTSAHFEHQTYFK